MRKIIWAGAVFLGLLLGFLLFYRPAPLTERQQLQAEAEMHKVKRITQKQVETEAMRLGNNLVVTADSLLSGRLTAALKTGGVTAALKNYPPQHFSGVQQQARQAGATLTRTGAIGPANSGGAAQVKTARHNQILYTKPIVINSSLCLACHGTVGQDVSAATLAELNQFKPGFKLTGFKTGERLGTWQISFKRQALLENLSRRSRKSFKPE